MTHAFGCRWAWKHRTTSAHDSRLAVQVGVEASYHLGDTALTIQRATLTGGGSETLVYTTLSGSVGVLAPLTTKVVDPHSTSLVVVRVLVLVLVRLRWSMTVTSLSFWPCNYIPGPVPGCLSVLSI